MTAQEILDTLDKRVKEAEARNIKGHEFYIRVSGRWSENFPGDPQKIASMGADRGMWILTLDEARDLRDYLTDHLNSAKKLEETIGPKPEPQTPRSSDPGKEAAKRAARGVPKIAHRRGAAFPWEGA